MLIQIDRKYVDAAWPIAAPMLAPAVALNQGETTLDQLRAQVAFGAATLLVWQENDVPTGAGVIHMEQYPNLRVAHFSYFGGRGLVNPRVFEEVKTWCRSQGATELRGYCRDEAHARLYRRAGCDEIYRVMRSTL
jgi:hypothetical protein